MSRRSIKVQWHFFTRPASYPPGGGEDEFHNCFVRHLDNAVLEVEEFQGRKITYAPGVWKRIVEESDAN